MKMNGPAIPIPTSGGSFPEPVRESGPDCYLSNANKIDPGCSTLQQANVQARFRMKDCEQAAQRGEWRFDPQAHQMIERYRRQHARPGCSTFNRSDDHIYG